MGKCLSSTPPKENEPPPNTEPRQQNNRKQNNRKKHSDKQPLVQETNHTQSNHKIVAQSDDTTDTEQPYEPPKPPTKVAANPTIEDRIKETQKSLYLCLITKPSPYLCLIFNVFFVCFVHNFKICDNV